ncbi:hypothetical protein PG985_006236 [Apiospora marii]|uniref:VPS37 C-terminal domain-containing protein n=1 Tax=Apiospora marii TaxID=335849 RepID=A0ABR1S728_9PEZI
MYSPTPPPPIPPPKPSSHDASRLGTPATSQSPRPPPIPDMLDGRGRTAVTDSAGLIPAARQAQPPEEIQDPGEQWLPRSALTENLTLAAHLVDLETRVSQQRTQAQAQLLSTHALERQWRQKQAEMDAALSSFAPAALYGRLTQALSEQEQICDALEESFLDGGRGAPPPSLSYDDDAAGGLATEREVLDWVRRYREARKLYYLRQERKERWNERRVGGWR